MAVYTRPPKARITDPLPPSRLAKRERSPFEVRCPKCGAPARSPCRFPSGLPILPHLGRLRLVRMTRQRFDQIRHVLWEQIRAYVEAELTVKELAHFRSQIGFLQSTEKR